MIVCECIIKEQVKNCVTKKKKKKSAVYVCNEAQPYCTISWVCKLPRNWSSICQCHRLQIRLLCNLDNVFSILRFVIRACALACATEADNTEKKKNFL